MSRFVRFALVLAVAVSACTDQFPVGPQSSSGYSGTPIAPPVPSGLSVSFVDLDGNVLISWSYQSSSDRPGFIVERALEADGPWSTVRFTTASSIKDRIDDGLRHCYRVTVLRSAPSGAVCVVRPEKL